MSIDINNTELLKKFKFKTTGTVRFHEVDSFKVAHNLQYLYWTEVSRVDYCKLLEIGIVPVSQSEPEFSVFLVNAEISYFQPAYFLDDYFVHTRVKRIGNSSIEFEHIVSNTKNEILAVNRVVEAYVDKNKKSIILPENIRTKIINFEGDTIEY